MFAPCKNGCVDSTDPVRKRIAEYIASAEKLKKQLREQKPEAKAVATPDSTVPVPVAPPPGCHSVRDILKQGDDAAAKNDHAKALELWKKGLSENDKVAKESGGQEKKLNGEEMRHYLEKVENATNKIQGGNRAVKKGAEGRKEGAEATQSAGKKLSHDSRRSRSRDRNKEKKKSSDAKKEEKQSVQTPCSFSSDVAKPVDRKEAARATLKLAEEVQASGNTAQKQSSSKGEDVPVSKRPDDSRNKSRSKESSEKTSVKDKSEENPGARPKTPVASRDEKNGNAHKRARHDSPKGKGQTAEEENHTRSKATSSAPPPVMVAKKASVPIKIPTSPAKAAPSLVAIPKSSFAASIQPGAPASGPPAAQAASTARRALLVGKAKAKAKS